MLTGCKRLFFLLTLFCFTISLSQAADRFWVAAAPSNWNNTANWSTVSGGAEIIRYEAIDQQPLKGRSFYRLKQTDFDGQFEYSPIVSVENLSDFRKISVFPNPVTNGFINLSFEGLEGEEMVIEIDDVLGKIMQTRSIEIIGLYEELRLSTNSYAPGIYYLRMHTVTGVEVYKIIID